MKFQEALDATTETRHMLVATKSGAEYIVSADTLLEVDDSYVYGERTNAVPTNRFKRGRGASNGDIRWFYLKSVKLIKANI